MSKLAVHVQHFKKASVGGIGSHNFYKRGEKDKHSNQDIDPSRSSENVLFVVPETTFYKDVKCLVEQSTGRVTANSIWVSEWIIYPPENLQDPKTADKEQVLEYFADVREWMQQQGYTIPMAAIHFDESTVHGHFDTVPLTDDGRLSRKDIYTRARLNSIHTDLAKHLESKGWDIQRGDSTAGKQVRSKSVVEYKKQAEAEKKQLIKEIEVLKEDIRQITSVLTPEQIEAIKTEKTLFGSVKVPQKEYEALKRTALQVESMATERDQALTERDKALVQADTADERVERVIANANAQLKQKIHDVNEQLYQKAKEIEMQHPDAQLQMLNSQLKKSLEEAEKKKKAAEETLERLKYNFDRAVDFIKTVGNVMREQPELRQELKKETKPPVTEMVVYTDVKLQKLFDEVCGTNFARPIEIRQRLNYFDFVEKKYGLSMNQTQERIGLIRELRELTGENYKAPVQQRGNSRDER